MAQRRSPSESQRPDFVLPPHAAAHVRSSEPPRTSASKSKSAVVPSNPNPPNAAASLAPKSPNQGAAKEPAISVTGYLNSPVSNGYTPPFPAFAPMMANPQFDASQAIVPMQSPGVFFQSSMYPPGMVPTGHHLTANLSFQHHKQLSDLHMQSHLQSNVAELAAFNTKPDSSLGLTVPLTAFCCIDESWAMGEFASPNMEWKILQETSDTDCMLHMPQVLLFILACSFAVLYP